MKMGIDCGFARVCLWETKSMVQKTLERRMVKRKDRTRVASSVNGTGYTWRLSKIPHVCISAKVSN